ncbi:Splicing factor Cactin [Dirofilaria immitis]
MCNGGLVAQWITRRSTEPKIAGSTPAEYGQQYYDQMRYKNKENEKHKHKHDNEKRKKRRRHHERGSSSSSSDKNERFDQRLDALREEKKQKKKKEKEKRKAMETTEEKKARRLTKKLKKAEKKSSAIFDDEAKYTNANNPFNDPNLTSTFIWTKKLAAEGKADLSLKQIEKMNRDRTLKNLAEMEELKKNREARDAAREDLEMIKRDEERRHNSDWYATEEGFLLSQAKLRTQIRLKEGRAKPIDFLARYISYDSEKVESKKDEEFELVDPITYLRGLKIRDLEDLLEDIKVYRRIDPTDNSIWWTDFCTIVRNEIRKLSNDVNSTNARESVHNSVQNDVTRLFKGKTHQELALLETQIKKKVHSGESGVDVEFLEFTLQHLHVHMAKARIQERHQEILRYKLKKIKEEHMVEKDQLEREPEQICKQENYEDFSGAKQSAKLKVLPIQLDELDDMDDDVKEQQWRLLTENEMEILTLEMYERGSYSPSYGDEKEAMPGIEILDEAEDVQRREEMMNKAENSSAASTSNDLSMAEAKMELIARRGMTNDEAAFSVEAPLEAQTFLWSEKYRPRKPRYFNRVHTGFEWNKYNQTHYDMDNPPPKIVQGYRFNIFYPDLLDVTETPTFTVTPCDDPDFAVIRFHAGPPYEDIAFKCVNREWEISHKHGYKCHERLSQLSEVMSYKLYSNGFGFDRHRRSLHEPCGLVAQWITRRSTEPKIAGSTPAEVPQVDMFKFQAVVSRNTSNIHGRSKAERFLRYIFRRQPCTIILIMQIIILISFIVISIAQIHNNANLNNDYLRLIHENNILAQYVNFSNFFSCRYHPPAKYDASQCGWASDESAFITRIYRQRIGIYKCAPKFEMIPCDLKYPASYKYWQNVLKSLNIIILNTNNSINEYRPCPGIFNNTIGKYGMSPQTPILAPRIKNINPIENTLILRPKDFIMRCPICMINSKFSSNMRKNYCARGIRTLKEGWPQYAMFCDETENHPFQEFCNIHDAVMNKINDITAPVIDSEADYHQDSD